MESLQTFSDEYLSRCRAMSSDEIARFLDDFRNIHSATAGYNSTSKLISMKVPQDLLAAFKTKSSLIDTPYQTQIKRLMVDWLTSSS